MQSSDKAHCHNCQTPLTDVLEPVSRGQECSACRSDVRVCLNCHFYDSKAYNECREPQADRVVKKDRANFCDYFKLGKGEKSKAASSKDASLKQLDDLFKE